MTDTQQQTDGRGGRSSATARLSRGMEPDRAQLVTEAGRTRIGAGVVEKIAGYAAREIPGVHAMGGGMARRVGQLRGLVGGSEDKPRQGVSVEVSERQATIELDVVTWYGQSIVDVCDAVRRNVTERVQAMTGLTVTGVDINVDDVYVEGESPDEEQGSR
jgi:uncharacterized alkaline shock family protein YloU